MNLPPLQLDPSGALLVDNSFFELLQTCATQCNYNRIHKRILASARPALDFGSAIHLALEWRFKNYQNNAVDVFGEEEQAAVLEEFFIAHPVAEDEHRNLSFAIELMQHYNQVRRLEPFQVLQYDKPRVCECCNGSGTKIADFSTETVTTPCRMCRGTGKNSIMAEVPFSLPLCEVRQGLKMIPVVFIGKIDLPVIWDNEIVITDHKTGSMGFGGPDRFIQEHICAYQPLGYCYAFEETTGQKVSGFCINGIGTKKPPLYVQDPSRRTAKQMTPEQWWNNQFPRAKEEFALKPNWKAEWESNAIEMVERFFWYYQRGVFPTDGRFTRACAKYDGCQYQDVCFLDSEERRLGMLTSNVFTDNKWSPLHK